MKLYKLLILSIMSLMVSSCEVKRQEMNDFEKLFVTLFGADYVNVSTKVDSTSTNGSTEKKFKSVEIDLYNVNLDSLKIDRNTLLYASCYFNDSLFMLGSTGIDALRFRFISGNTVGPIDVNASVIYTLTRKEIANDAYRNLRKLNTANIRCDTTWLNKAIASSEMLEITDLGMFIFSCGNNCGWSEKVQLAYTDALAKLMVKQGGSVAGIMANLNGVEFEAITDYLRRIDDKELKFTIKSELMMSSGNKEMRYHIMRILN